MLIDTTLQFTPSSTSVIAGVGTTSIGSQIDTAIAGQLDCEDLWLVIVATQPITAIGAGTLQFALASDITPALSGSSQIEFITEPFATPIAGGSTLFIGALPKSVGTYTPNRRYLGLLQIVGGSAINAGTINAFLSPDTGRWIPTATVAN